ncbi:MAG: hypothetical protein INR69_07220 [Mucilaginibacter polytrichastri]|nr:hypothetical protein [Mucilaginibacter polytrichastri]
MRVFRYTSARGGKDSLLMATNELLFAAPLSGDRFEIGNAEIQSGQIIYRFICPACDFIPMEAKSGRIKGQKADGNRWLIDATVYLGADIHGTPYSDTLHIKQYFTPGEVR